MKRSDGTAYFCFECAYFSGGKWCYKHLRGMPRKGWDESCADLALAALGEQEEAARKARYRFTKARVAGLI